MRCDDLETEPTTQWDDQVMWAALSMPGASEMFDRLFRGPLYFTLEVYALVLLGILHHVYRKAILLALINRASSP